MDPRTESLADAQWVAQCAERLRRRWPRADRTSLEDTARELALTPELRRMPPSQAAEKWVGELA